MSSVDDDSSDSLISIARAVRTRGLKGEIVAELLTDFPDRFHAVDRVIGLSPAGQRSSFQLEGFWFQKDRIILKFAAVDSIEDAQALVGYEFCIPEGDRVPLNENEYYDFELEGCLVCDASGREIGKVQSILKTGATEILEIGTENGASVLVPLAESIVTKIDVSAKQIVIDPPEGLLDLS
jgi:16S rRNA processing protein RimM